ncbi:MAG: hypothetical protein AAGF60_13535 [Pseudomonadota bacterium]
MTHGAAALAQLDALPAWEAGFVRHVRMWSGGAVGAAQVMQDYGARLPEGSALQANQALGQFLAALSQAALRPLVLRTQACRCAGADECVVLHIVRTASDGQLTDAAMVAALVARPAEAERLALMAGEVGTNARHISAPLPGPFPTRLAQRLH